MDKEFSRYFLVLIALFFVILVFVHGSSDYSVQEALKVIGLIDKIQREQIEKGGTELRNVVVTESELNSYFAFRIETEKEEIMKELRLKLFEENKIEGKVVIDLKGQKLPDFLPPKMTFYLGGKLEVEQGRARLVLKKLFLENQAIQPMVLDIVIFIGSKIQNTEPFSLKDWYELPYGIKDIKTQQGKATFYY